MSATIAPSRTANTGASAAPLPRSDTARRRACSCDASITASSLSAHCGQRRPGRLAFGAERLRLCRRPAQRLGLGLLAGVADLAGLACDRFAGLLGLVGLFALHRSEEHTSELQSLMRISYAVFCLNKKTTT